MKSMVTFDGYDDGKPSQQELWELNNQMDQMLRGTTDMVTFITPKIILVDDWIPELSDAIFKHLDKAIVLPVSSYYGLNNSTDLDYFILSPKRCYNRPEVRMHTTHYLNYFTKFYDPDRELMAIYFNLKYIMDFNKEYNKHNFMCDIQRYIIHNKSLLQKIFRMNEDNYIIPLSAKRGRSVPSLQYNTRHGKILMQMSLLMNMVIPLVSHFAYLKNIDNIDGIFLEVYDEILDLSDVDMYSKMYETAVSEVKKSESIHAPLWSMQDIRGINGTTQAMNSVENIMLNIMPKYRYDQNIISFNVSSIRNNTGFKITDIKYEYNFTLLSSSNRDEDFNSDQLRSLVVVILRCKLFELLGHAKAYSATT